VLREVTRATAAASACAFATQAGVRRDTPAHEEWIDGMRANSGRDELARLSISSEAERAARRNERLS